MCVCVCVVITGYVDLRVPILLPGVMCNGQKSYTVYLDHIFLHTGTVHSIGCPLSTGVHLLCILSSLYFPTMSGMVSVVELHGKTGSQEQCLWVHIKVLDSHFHQPACLPVSGCKSTSTMPPTPYTDWISRCV